MTPQRSFLLCLWPTVFLNGCTPTTGAHSPTVDVIGSYFPAWMVCIVAGITATVATRALLLGLRLDPHVCPKGLVYPCMVLCFTLAAWLIFFQN